MLRFAEVVWIQSHKVLSIHTIYFEMIGKVRKHIHFFRFYIVKCYRIITDSIHTLKLNHIRIHSNLLQAIYKGLSQQRISEQTLNYPFLFLRVMVPRSNIHKLHECYQCTKPYITDVTYIKTTLKNNTHRSQRDSASWKTTL